MGERKAAVLFPGIGYHADRPLLYYSGRMARAFGYEVIPVPYTGFPKKLIGDAQMMRKAYDIGFAQAEEILAGKNLQDCDELIFFSKSIGTAIGGAYADRHHLDGRTRHVLYTPVEATFSLFRGRGIAFHGTADPWVTDEIVEKRCREMDIPLYEYADANHSIETGDVLRDIENLSSIMQTVHDFLSAGRS